MQAFSGCGQQGSSPLAVCRLLTAGVSLVEEQGSRAFQLSSCCTAGQQSCGFDSTFLMINDDEYVFPCLLTICVSSLEYCVFKSFVHFLNCVVYVLLLKQFIIKKT